MRKLFVMWGIVSLLLAVIAMNRAAPQQPESPVAALMEQMFVNPLDVGALAQSSGMVLGNTVYTLDAYSQAPATQAISQPAEEPRKFRPMPTYTKAAHYSDTSKRQLAMEAVLNAAPTAGFRAFVRRI